MVLSTSCTSVCISAHRFWQFTCSTAFLSKGLSSGAAELLGEWLDSQESCWLCGWGWPGSCHKAWYQKDPKGATSRREPGNSSWVLELVNSFQNLSIWQLENKTNKLAANSVHQRYIYIYNPCCNFLYRIEGARGLAPQKSSILESPPAPLLCYKIKDHGLVSTQKSSILNIFGLYLGRSMIL